MKGTPSLILVLILSVGITHAQNFSGLQNKRLTKIEDVGSLLESGIGSLLGGKIKGNIDSVVITWDSEKTLKGKIWYTEYTAGFFTVSVMTGAKQKQSEIIVASFPQTAKPSPVEFTLEMAASVPKGTEFESPFLRIDISKKENRSGNVNVFALNKKWRNQLDPQNVVVTVNLQPVGRAASLTSTPADVVPGKTIRFDPNILYMQPKTKTMKLGGGNRYSPFSYAEVAAFEDISGTWLNTDVNTNGITKLIVTGNSYIQGFGRCHPTDCEWGKVAMASIDANNFKAVFTWSSKTTTLMINYSGGQLSVTGTDQYTKALPPRNYFYTFRKNAVAVRPVTQIYTLDQVAIMKPPVGVAIDKAPRGPNKNVQIYLLDGLSADVDFNRPQEISNININVFADKNINSGIFYILPADYHLKWEAKVEPEKGYDFRILYGSQRTSSSSTTETATDAPVRMSATLTAGISTRERNFVKALLKAVRPDFVDLRYLPLRENPQFTFGNTLGAQYNIPPDKITVETSTDLTNDIRVAWQTDADTKEFIQTALTSREGISASVILKPDDEDILDQQIPAMINLADMRTLGKMNLEPTAWRTRNWRNTTPYPLKLKYLHVMKKAIGGTKPIIYSWSMNDMVVPSQAQVQFDHSRIPTWLDTDASSVMWIEYSVEDCGDCDRRVMDAVTGGVSGTKSQQVKFTIPPAVFDSLRASYFLITVRSRQVDPKGETLVELPPVKVTSDMTKEFSAGPFFLPAAGSIDYEYKITAASTDGDFYPSNTWYRATDKELLLGKTKMKDIFRGIIPGIN